MSVPAMFPPVEIGGREYVDGGMAQIVPRVKFPTRTREVDVVCSEPLKEAPRWAMRRLIIPLCMYAAMNAMTSRIAEADLEWIGREYEKARVVRPIEFRDFSGLLGMSGDKCRRLHDQGWKETLAKRNIQISLN